MLDIGTGTGVLAIAAAKALHRPVLASDIDARAVTTARENACINRVGASVQVIHAAGLGARPFRARASYDVIFANILLEPLKRLATPMARLVAPNGRVVLSGLLTTQAGAALASYRARGLVLLRRIAARRLDDAGSGPPGDRWSGPQAAIAGLRPRSCAGKHCRAAGRPIDCRHVRSPLPVVRGSEPSARQARRASRRCAPNWRGAA